MSYSLKEVQAIIGELLQYSYLEEIYADIEYERERNGLEYIDIGKRYGGILMEFASDSSIK